MRTHHALTLLPLLGVAVFTTGMVGDCNGGYDSYGQVALSDRTLMQYMISSPSGTTGRLVYAVLLRGQPGWFQGSQSTSANSSLFGSSNTFTTATARVEIRYNALLGTLQVGGHTIKLRNANVLLVDSVDQRLPRLPVRPAGRFDLPLTRDEDPGSAVREHSPSARSFAAGA